MKTVRVQIKPALLIWAREGLGYSLAEAAKKLGVSEDRLAAWETGEDRPTINQLRKMAEAYKRPLAVFFLPEPPEGFQVMKDFRRLPGTIAGRYSPPLLLEIRRAQERRQLSLDLFTDIDEKAKPFTLKATSDEDPEAVSVRIRSSVGVVYEQQVTWRDQRTAFNRWRGAIEAAGVLVFQATHASLDEMRGLSLAERLLPVIAVNRRDYPSARTFSLLHEFVHLMLHRSGLCDIDEANDRPPEENEVEILCNRIAAAALMPPDRILAEDLVTKRGAKSVAWTDDEIAEIANRYSVSREALVRRLLTLGRTTQAFYSRKRAQYLDEFKALKDKQRQQQAQTEYRKNPPREAISDLGRSFVGLVMENYYQDRLTLSEVSEYLGLRVRHIPKVQELMGA